MSGTALGIVFLEIREDGWRREKLEVSRLQIIIKADSQKMLTLFMILSVKEKLFLGVVIQTTSFPSIYGSPPKLE